MQHGILKVGLVALSATLAPNVNAQTRTSPAVAGRQVVTSPATAMAAAIPRLPNFVGLTADSATRLLALLRLSAVRRDTSTNATPRDRVIAQKPVPGTPLSTIRQVTLIVAIPVRRVPLSGAVVAQVTPSGVIIPPGSVATTPPLSAPPSTIVPPLVGRNLRSAFSFLAEAHLRLDRSVVTDFSDVTDSGFVFQQHPPARTRVDTGSFVKIWISLGPHRMPPTVTTPNVLGRSIAVADSLLRAARLVVGHVDTTFQSGARGQIEHQLPEAGAQVHPGDAVALGIAMAPALITVPSVIGLRRAEAQIKLREVGLALGQITPVMVSGRDTVIIGQTPSAQVAVVRGTFVDVEENQPVARRRTVVPNLGGLTSDAATQRLTRDGLSLGRVVVSDSGVAPVVVAQRPTAGDSAFFHDAVSVTLASPAAVPGPESPAPPIALVAVPAVTNLSFELARRLIDSRGLATVSTSFDTGRVFVVRSQRPAAGSLVPVGATVTLALEPLHLRSVPHLVGLERATAEEHATADGYTMSIKNRRRVLLPFFEMVATQESDMLTMARGDQTIEVDLSSPLIPPVPAGIALVLVAAGTAMTVRIKRPPRGKGRPLTDLDIAVVLTAPAPPVLSPIPNDRVIRTAITFQLDYGRGEWTVESEANSLISHIETHA